MDRQPWEDRQEEQGSGSEPQHPGPCSWRSRPLARVTRAPFPWGPLGGVQVDGKGSSSLETLRQGQSPGKEPGMFSVSGSLGGPGAD